jgi:hypothetical protein
MCVILYPLRWWTEIKLYQPDWTTNDTHPAQYWSGPSQNGTVFMLVRISAPPRSWSKLTQGDQINTMDEPSDLLFFLTESPWIRAGRQYTVRVCDMSSSHHRPRLELYPLTRLDRTFGLIRLMELQSNILSRTMYLRMGLLHCYCKMLGTSLMVYVISSFTYSWYCHWLRVSRPWTCI